MRITMNELNENPRRYQWPWLALAAALLAIVLAVVWMAFAVKKVERERNFSAPMPNSAPMR